MYTVSIYIQTCIFDYMCGQYQARMFLERADAKDYILFFFVAMVVVVCSGGIHFQMLRWDCQIHRKEFTGMLLPSLYATQLVNCLQMLVLLQKIDVSWGEPFVGLLEAFSFLSLEDVMRFFHAVSCAAPPSPAVQFLIQTVVLPISLMLGPVVVHVARVFCVSRWMPRSSQWQVLFQCLGLFLLFCYLFAILAEGWRWVSMSSGVGLP